MKKISIKFLLIPFLFLIVACKAQNNKLKSQHYIQLSDSILREAVLQSTVDTSKYLKALEYLNLALKIDTLNVRAYNDKVTIFQMLKKTDEMKTSLLQLLHIKPEFAEGYFALGSIYENKNQLDSAKMYFKMAKLNYLKRPANDSRNSNLIIVEYMISKDKDKALSKLKEYPIENKEVENSVISQIKDIKKNGIH